MKTLLILRHAKSSWKEEGMSDHERPLNKRGQRDAPQIGELLAELDLLPDIVVCSTAKRTRLTAEMVTAAAGYAGEIYFSDELYESSPRHYVEVLRQLPDDPQRALVIGHNPTSEELVAALTGQIERMPTGALARVDLNIDAWSALQLDGRGTLTGMWRPKELD